jgi:hypothetical protein
MFKVETQKDSVQLEMNPEELNLAVRIASYIDENFDASDFFTIGNTSHEGLKVLANILKNKQKNLQQDCTKLSLSLDKERYRIFKQVFMHGRSFLDDTEEFEAEHDEIEAIADVMSPPRF